jgi:hypothetical protein
MSKGDPARIPILKVAYRRWQKQNREQAASFDEPEPEEPDTISDRPLSFWELEQTLNY